MISVVKKRAKNDFTSISEQLKFGLVSAIVGLLLGFTNILPAIGQIIYIMGTSIVIYGTITALKCVKNQQDFSIKTFFDTTNAANAILTQLLMTIYLVLWALLIIPFYIKRYSYALSTYIIHDDPSISANQAITMSRRLMNGYKFKLFCLDLSFIGWFFIVILTFGLGSVYVIPYYQMARYEFYLEVKQANQL